MASGEVTVKVYRSGPLHIVAAGDAARLIDAAEGEVGEVVLLGSLLAHVHVSDPWEDVTDADDLPPLVRTTADAMRKDPPKVPKPD